MKGESSGMPRNLVYVFLFQGQKYTPTRVDVASPLSATVSEIRPYASQFSGTVTSLTQTSLQPSAASCQSPELS